MENIIKYVRNRGTNPGSPQGNMSYLNLEDSVSVGAASNLDSAQIDTANYSSTSNAENTQSSQRNEDSRKLIFKDCFVNIFNKFWKF